MKRMIVITAIIGCFSGTIATAQLSSCCEVNEPSVVFDEPRFSLPAELSGGFAFRASGETKPFIWHARVLPTWAIGSGQFRVGVGASASFFNPQWEPRLATRFSFNLRNIPSAELGGTRVGVFWLSVDGSYGKLSGATVGLTLQYDLGPRMVTIGGSLARSFGSTTTAFESSFGSDILGWSYKRDEPIPYEPTSYYDRISSIATDELLSDPSALSAYRELDSLISLRSFESLKALSDSLRMRDKNNLGSLADITIRKSRQPIASDCTFVIPVHIDERREVSYLLSGWSEAIRFPYRALAKEARKQAVFYRDGLSRIDSLPDWKTVKTIVQLKQLLASRKLDPNRVDSTLALAQRVVEHDVRGRFFADHADERQQVAAIREGFCKAARQWKGRLPGTDSSIGRTMVYSSKSRKSSAGSSVTALVISGGGSKGAFAVGAVEDLLVEQNIHFDIICGTSTGALIAPFVAAHQLGKKRMFQTLQEMYTSFSTPQIAGARNARELLHESSLFSNEGLQRTMLQTYTSDFVDALISSDSVTVVFAALNLNSGETEYFYTGKDLKVTKGIARRIRNRQQFIDAVLASASFEVLLPPRRIQWYGDSLYADGGPTDVLPVRVAIDNGATDIYAIPLGSPLRSRSSNTQMTSLDVLLRTLDIYGDEVVRDKLRYDSLYTDAIRYITNVKSRLIENTDNLPNEQKEIEQKKIAAAFNVNGKDFSQRPEVNITYIQSERDLGEAFNLFTIAFDPQAMTEMMVYGKRRAREAAPQMFRFGGLAAQAR